MSPSDALLQVPNPGLGAERLPHSLKARPSCQKRDSSGKEIIFSNDLKKKKTTRGVHNNRTLVLPLLFPWALESSSALHRLGFLPAYSPTLGAEVFT